MFAGVTFIPAAIQLVCLPFCPESPRFIFLVRKQPDNAEKGEITDEHLLPARKH